MSERTLPAPSARRSFDRRRLLLGSLVAAGVAAVANLVVFGIARRLFDVSFVMPYQGRDTTPERMPIALVVVMSVVPVLIAAAVLWALYRFTEQPLRTFRAIGLVVLVVSLAGPLTLEDTATSTKLALIVMHVIAAAAILSILPASVQESASAAPNRDLSRAPEL